MRSDLPHPVQVRLPPLRPDAGPGHATPLHELPQPPGALSLDVPIALGAVAPRTARKTVADALTGRVSSAMVQRAKLVVSELVTNSLVHSGAGEGAEVTVTLRSGAHGCRIEVQDPGRQDGVIAPRLPDRVNGGGMGLIVVDAMCAQRGVLRDEDGSSRVWAELIDDDLADHDECGRSR